MPELPEVETTRRGIAPWVEGQRIHDVVIRQHRLRWPISAQLRGRLRGQHVNGLTRRGKYLLLDTENGTALLHLGMSGSLRLLRQPRPADPHDHFDIVLDSGYCVRFTDPRRFGSLLWAGRYPLEHPLLANLGPEPLEPGFDGDYLWHRARRRRIAIKPFLMNGQIVVGVGNIYASEALFRAGLPPRRAAGRISRAGMGNLADSVRAVLQEAVNFGGTTLRDFYSSAGEPGYFRNELRVYERAGLPCLACETLIRQIVQGQRSTYFCPSCQK